MDLETLARLGEFVGGFFVVVSLFYLGHQVRQNTRSLRAENYARVLDRLSTLQSNLSSDRELNRIVTLGARSPDSLTPEERTRMTWALYELLGATEFVFHQAEDQALPDAVWDRWQATLAWWVSHPGIQWWWRSRPSPFTPAFERLVDDLIANSPVDQEAMRRWRRFIDGPDAEPVPVVTQP